MNTEVTKKSQMMRAVWGSLVLLGTVGLIVIVWNFVKAPPHPADVVKWWGWHALDDGGKALARIETDLKEVTIPEVDFQDKTLVESLDYIFEKLNEDGQYEREIKYVILNPEKYKDTKVTLKLANVPVVSTLRYVVSLADSTYSIELGAKIKIIPLRRPPGITLKRKFRCPSIYFPSYKGSGPFDLGIEFATAGLNFDHGDFAEYYPDKGVLVVQSREDQLELVDAYLGAVKISRELNLIEKASMRIRAFFAPSVAPLPPVRGSMSPAVDPFAP